MAGPPTYFGVFFMFKPACLELVERSNGLVVRQSSASFA
jgi:hypothetical protein